MKNSKICISKPVAVFTVLLAVLLLIPMRGSAQESAEEHIARINRKIEEQGLHWIAGPTGVSNLTPEEKQMRLGRIPPPIGSEKDIPVLLAPEGAVYDPIFDWRSNNGTTPVTDQLSCGSCWAFAAVAQMESHILIYDDRPLDLSEQQIIECNSYNNGCDGGWAGAAYEVLADHGAVLEACMPYEARDDLPCVEDQCESQGRISGYTYIPSSVNSIKEALLDGPVWAGIDIVDDFYSYHSGCFSSTDPVVGAHAILIVGWNDSSCGGNGAWIIKNSWGEDWGYSGYGYVEYGSCNIGSPAYQIDYIPNTVYVHVGSPNGGEELGVGTLHDITWSTSRETPDSVSIMLSLDGGLNYSETVSTGLIGVESYEWTVPSLPVSTCRIRVLAYFGGDVEGFDESDDDFTIVGAPYRYVSPSGDNIYPFTIPQWAAHSIQDAVDACDPGDTIMVEGAYYGGSLTITSAVYILGGWDSGFTVRDPESYTTTISGPGSVISFMYIDSGTHGIEGCTITGGSGRTASLPASSIYGGGIFSYESSPVIKGNVFTACGDEDRSESSGGGAICCYDGSPVIEDNEISGCFAQAGAGIYLYSTQAAISGNHIQGCSPSEEYLGIKSGGGIYALASTVSLDGNVIEDNGDFTSGGGLYVKFCSMYASGDTIRYNSCTDNGGGIYSERSDLALTQSVITGNTAGFWGGGIYQGKDSLGIENTIIALNNGGIGGGIFADSIWGGISNSTIDRNTGTAFGGNLYLMNTADLDISNNMITYASQYGFHTASPDNITFSYNNCFGSTPADISGLSADSTNTSADPLYADTTTLDYHLLVHSVGIDAGDPSGGTDPDGSRADQGAFGGASAVMAACDYVENLTATAIGDTTIELSWDPVPQGDLSYYAVYADTVPGFRPAQELHIASPAPGTTSFSHHPVSGCLYYRVSAVDLDGYGGGYSAEASECAAGEDQTPPSVTVVHPNGGEIYETGDTISITWIATDNRGVIDSVSIYFSENGGDDFVLIAHGEPNDSLYSWIDPSPVSDSCIVMIVAYDPALLTGEDESDDIFKIELYTATDMPPRFVNELRQNYPNPFNGTTTITYSVASSSRVELSIYNVAGQLVKVLERREKAPGTYRVVWDGRDDAGRGAVSGIYFMLFRAGDFMQTRKIVYLR